MKSPESIDLVYWLKGQAEDLQHASPQPNGLKRSAALEAVARKYGFTNWHVAVAQGKGILLLNQAERQLFPKLDQSHQRHLLRERAREVLRHRWPHRSVEASVSVGWQDARRPPAGGGSDSGDDDAPARQAMEAWFRGKYTPLIDFAFYDPESENGFAWDDVDPHAELREEFEGKYPIELIKQVADGLLDEGPWGIEDYGDD